MGELLALFSLAEGADEKGWTIYKHWQVGIMSLWLFFFLEVYIYKDVQCLSQFREIYSYKFGLYKRRSNLQSSGGLDLQKIAHLEKPGESCSW